MDDRSLPHLLAVFGPLFLLGLGSGVLRALASRPDAPPGRRRLLGAAWVLLLLVGAPAWLFLAATLGL